MAELEQQIQKDIVEAMKAKDTVKLNAVRAIKSAILLEKTSGNGTEITDAVIQKLVQKLIKQRKESAEMYTQGGRQELADNELAEAKAMECYIPKQLDEAEVEEILKAIIAEVGASKPSDMGKVMGVATKKLAGQAEGKLISTLVKKLLA
ncbi:MAG: GatB/YqeY domain-containing protein [Bacteroidales bacterium]|nr:GatB/YqeY domain-containing protein [Bacteroidales bacterium]